MKKILLALIIGLLMPTSLWAQENIQFADALVKELCVQHWDTNGDGELSTDEAAAVTDVTGVFTYNWNVRSFNEFRYFTGVTTIGGDAFHMCGLTSIDLPANVKVIGGSAFNETNLTTIDGGVTVGGIVIPEGVTTLEWEAFACNPGFTSARIPASVTSIAGACFRSCVNLATFSVDPGNTVYRAYDDILYESNTGLVAYPTPKSGVCVIPEDIETVYEFAFYNISVNDLTLPSTLKTMREQWFIQEDLHRIFSDSPNPPQIDEYTFREYNYENTTLFVPRGAKAAYQAAEVWSRFQNIEEFGEPVQGEAEPYAVLSDNNTVLTFYYDDQKDARGGMGVGKDMPLWYDQTEGITSVVFDPSMANCTTITSTASWFHNCSNLVNITGLEYLNTSNVTTMRGMFYGCQILANLDLGTFNTENVTDMSFMFDGCTNLRELNIRNFNTSNVTTMLQIFNGCRNLTNLDVSHFDTSNVQDFFNMFSECSSLTYLDVSNFNTSSATEMVDMFWGCTNLKSLDLKNFDTSNVTRLGAMFNGCASLTSLDLSSFDTSNVTGMGYMFYGCSSLIDVNISSFNTDKVTDFDVMFSWCSSLASIQAGSANIPDSVYAEIGNPNLLVYVNDAASAPASVQNVVINGQAQNIILTDVANGNGNFYCPQEFQAEQISYSRNFTQTTEVGVSRGWESIALPFDVQSIVHETKGTIVPFGSAADGYNFWLRRMGDNGLEQATQIEANRGYVISMPNSNDYPEVYRLNGVIRFSAQQTVVPVTQPTAAEYTVANESVTLIPTFRRMAASDDVYALNVGETRGGYPEGSVFERALRDVRPFEAYTTHRAAGGSRARYYSLKTLGADNSLFTAIRNTTKDGADNETVKVYNLSGVLLREGRRNEAMRNLPKGVYIVGGQRVIVSQ